MVDGKIAVTEWEEHWWPAPAKLNLMLNIVGQRPDGYHELQTVFQLIGISDWLNVVPTEDGEITLSCNSVSLATVSYTHLTLPTSDLV